MRFQFAQSEYALVEYKETSENRPGPTSWRSVLSIHPAVERIPEPTDTEKRRLAGDLDQRGQQVRVVLVRVAGGRQQLLDGRTRLDLLEGLGIEVVNATGNVLVPHDIIDVADDAEAEARSLSLNLHRRQLKPGQTRKLVTALIKAQPEKSDRHIAEQAESNRTTVGQIRKALEKTGDVSIVDTRTDTRGRQQPASKVKTKKAKEKAPAPPQPVKRTRTEETKRLDAEAEALAAKLVAQLDDETARELHRQLHTTDHRVLWRLTEMLGRKLKVEAFLDDDDDDDDDANVVGPEASAEGMKATMAVLDAGSDPGPFPEILRREPKPKTLSNSGSGAALGDVIAGAFREFENLACECRDNANNIPENFEGKIDTLNTAADILDDLRAPAGRRRRSRSTGFRPATATPSVQMMAEAARDSTA